MLSCINSNWTICITMHSTNNVKLATAQQAKQIYQFKNIKQNVYRPNTAICYNKMRGQTQLTAHCISVRINGANRKGKKIFKISIMYFKTTERLSEYLRRVQDILPGYTQ